MIRPVIGVTLALPFFNQNGGEIAQAAAARLRARAELDLVRRETGAGRARARRSLEAALNRLARDRQLLEAADRVAAMSLQAYAEGAVPLANVLEAQRAAREALGRYVEDTAMANDAAAAVRLLETTEE
jgi:outer membrane protein TolC